MVRRSRTLGTLPLVAKPVLMRLPWPIWRHVVYPAWVRWYMSWGKLPFWRSGLYGIGDVVWWRGVKLICCTRHYAGDLAVHPWDPGHGWSEDRAAALWEPAGRRDRVLLRLVGDKRVRPAEETEG